MYKDFDFNVQNIDTRIFETGLDSSNEATILNSESEYDSMPDHVH